MDLNQPQQEAVTQEGGPLLVLAGAGSGKTRVITARVCHLLEKGVPPERILAVTFTNKAAGEMQERVAKEAQAGVYVTTFHALGARLLRESGEALGLARSFTIYDEDDVEKLLKACIKEFPGVDGKQVKQVRSLISQAKNAMQSPDDVERGGGGETPILQFPVIYRLYEQKLRQYNGVDFDDLLYLTVRLFQEHPQVLAFYQQRWWHLLVDEYQDTNASQYRLVQFLVGKHQNLCVVGDPDQSIYSWRGADIANILSFEQDFPNANVVRLEQNYRSTETILEAANALIAHNTQRYEKKLWSSCGRGEKIRTFTAETERFEAEFVVGQIRQQEQKGHTLSEMAILYRTNAQSRALEDALLREGLPYVLIGGISFYQRREIKDILAYLRVVHSSSDYISFARTVNLPKRGVGPATLEKLRLAAEGAQMGVITYCERLMQGEPLVERVKLSAKQKEGLSDYLGVIGSLREQAATSSIADLVKEVVTLSRYEEVLAQDEETQEERKENLDELLGKALEWEEEGEGEGEGLQGFLEELSLKSSADEKGDEGERVSLMTLHNSKGLEFDVVFLVGMERDLLPHGNSRGEAAAVEEERRLCYVGMTRARKQLYLTRAQNRFLWGTHRYMLESPFLDEIPQEYVSRSGPGGRKAVSSSPKRTNWRPTEVAKEEQEEEATFKKGDVVMHPLFGIGVIQKLSQSSRGRMYDIYFQNEREVKTLAEAYAKLTPL